MEGVEQQLHGAAGAAGCDTTADEGAYLRPSVGLEGVGRWRSLQMAAADAHITHKQKLLVASC